MPPCSTTRRATNLAQLLNYPAFFQLRPVLVTGTLALDAKTGRLRLSDETGGLPVIYKGNAPEGLVEVRGEFWDVGRMQMLERMRDHLSPTQQRSLREHLSEFGVSHIDMPVTPEKIWRVMNDA